MRTLLARICAASVLLATSTAQSADPIVSAAASLSNAFTEIGKDYEAANPGTRVLFNFGASGQLLQQISRGATADVFASADQETMNRAAAQGLVAGDTRIDFVSNKLVLVLSAGSRRAPRAISDLRDPEIRRIGLGTPESVPAGRYAKESLELAGEWDKLESKYVFGQNVRQVLDYVARDEVDAGFVYETDAALMADKVRVAFAATTRTPILYPIAVVKGSGNERVARRFIAFVTSDSSRKTLKKYGFGLP